MTLSNLLLLTTQSSNSLFSSGSGSTSSDGSSRLTYCNGFPETTTGKRKGVALIKDHEHSVSSASAKAMEHCGKRNAGVTKTRSRLLKDFRNNRLPNLKLCDHTDHVVECAIDQVGSRLLQQKLNKASIDKQLVFAEILPNSYNLMTDMFGNYVIQKLFEFGSHEQIRILVNQLRGNVLSLTS